MFFAYAHTHLTIGSMIESGFNFFVKTQQFFDLFCLSFVCVERMLDVLSYVFIFFFLLIITIPQSLKYPENVNEKFKQEKKGQPKMMRNVFFLLRHSYGLFHFLLSLYFSLDMFSSSFFFVGKEFKKPIWFIIQLLETIKEKIDCVRCMEMFKSDEILNNPLL